MIGYWLAGLLIIAIGVRDARVGHYKKWEPVFGKRTKLARYGMPVVWILVGIGMIVSGFLGI